MQGVIVNGAGGIVRPDGGDATAPAPALVWSIAGSAQIGEGEAAIYTVSYSGALAGGETATITVASGDGTAEAAGDYTALSTVLSFTGGGATSKTVAVSTIDDTEIEGTEDYTVEILDPSIGILGKNDEVTTDIVDDDAAFVADAVTFDGTNDYLSRGAGLTGAADSRKGWGSLWYRKSSAIGTNETFANLTSGKFLLSHHTFGSPAEKLRFLVVNSAGSANFEVRASIGLDNDGDWHHLAWYVDTDAAAGAKIGYIFHDGSDVTGSKTDAAAAFDIDFTQTDFTVGAQVAGPGGSKFAGDLAEFIFAPGQDFDISNPANLAKLRNSSTGKPVDVGADGSMPSGVAPLVYLSLDDGETPADNWAINAGGGGGMTVNGVLATAASNPTD